MAAAARSSIDGGMHPNLILVNVGTNDCLYNNDPANAGSRMKALLDYLFSALPSTTVILSTLLPSKRDDACMVAVNVQYRNLMSQYSGRRIALADMHNYLTVDDISGDGTHPNDFGYKKMASVWWDAIQHVQDQIQAPDGSVDDAHDVTIATCAKVAGNAAGSVQTQRGSGSNDGPYKHSSVAHGTMVTLPDVGAQYYHFGQLVNINGAARGQETDELIITEHAPARSSLSIELASQAACSRARPWSYEWSSHGSAGTTPRPPPRARRAPRLDLGRAEREARLGVAFAASLHHGVDRAPARSTTGSPFEVAKVRAQPRWLSTPRAPRLLATRRNPRSGSR